MNDRTNYSVQEFAAIAAAGAAAAASESEKLYPDDRPPELLTLNDPYVGGRWTDRYWNEQKGNFAANRSLAEIDAALMGISAVTRLLSCDEAQAADARENPDQVRYEALCPTLREGLRAAQDFMIHKAIFAIELLRSPRS